MNEVASNLSSPAWWFSAVAVALLINLLSAYAKGPLDRTIARLSLAWRTRTRAAAALYEAEVDRLSKDVNLQIIYLLEAQRYRSRSNGWLILLVLWAVLYGIGFQVRIAGIVLAANAPDVVEQLSVSSWPLFMMAALAVFTSMRQAGSAMHREQIVELARRSAHEKSAP